MTAAVGCQSGQNVASPYDATMQNRPQLAAYAARASYPEAEATDDMEIGALVDSNDRITLINFTNQDLRNANVWINGEYVQRLDVLPGNKPIQLDLGNFFNEQGATFGETMNRIDRVEISTRDEFIVADGPAFR